MLDVDGQVISADVLVERIEHLLEAVHSGAQTPGASSPNQPVAATPMDVPIHEMRVLHGQMRPPEIGAAGGFSGRVGGVLKRAIRRATSWYVEPRWILQQQLDGESIEFSALAYNSVYRIDNELDEIRRQIARLKMQLVTAMERTNRVRRELTGVLEELAGQSEMLGQTALQSDVRPLAKELTSILDRLGAVGTAGADIDYVEFQDRFRGDTDDLRASQERYLRHFQPSSVAGRIVDIGCGRGEMLSLLAEAGHEVMGVDTDPDMVEACNARGLPAVVDDGSHFLSRIDDDTLKGIFCAQVVEHLITPELERLIVLSREKLQPGGILVVETINPRSSYALGNHFYADTSHVRPVHPETLRYICEQAGFTSVDLEERSPHPLLGLTDGLPDGPVGEAVAALLENVFGHQDYVIVATK